MSEALSRVYLRGGTLPSEVDYFNLDEALRFLATRLVPLFDETKIEQEKDSAKNTLEFVLGQKFSQSFLLESHSDYQVAYELPLSAGEEGNYSISIDLKNRSVSCGGHQGELFVPKISLRYGVDSFITSSLSSEDRRRIEENNAVKITQTVQQSIKDKRADFILNLAAEARQRARFKGIELMLNHLPGTRLDFTEFLKARNNKLFERHTQSTLNSYYKKLGLKFQRGSRPGETAFWKELFPEDFLIS